MQQIDYSLIKRRPVAGLTPRRLYKSTFMDENRHTRFSDDDDVNNKINALIKEASEQLSEEILNMKTEVILQCPQTAFVGDLR